MQLGGIEPCQWQPAQAEGRAGPSGSGSIPGRRTALFIVGLAFGESLSAPAAAAIPGTKASTPVARGEADRSSDIDVQVIVADGVVDARRELQRLRQDVEAERFDGDRYELQLLVESVESVTTYGGDLQDLFREGITLYGTDRLDEVKGEILGGQ